MMAIVFTFILMIVNIVSVLAFGFILSCAIPRGIIRWLTVRLTENDDYITDELHYMRVTLGEVAVLICLFDSILLWAPDYEALNMFMVAELIALFISFISFTCHALYVYIQDYYYADSSNDSDNEHAINDDGNADNTLNINHGKIR